MTTATDEPRIDEPNLVHIDLNWIRAEYRGCLGAVKVLSQFKDKSSYDYYRTKMETYRHVWFSLTGLDDLHGLAQHDMDMGEYRS